MSWINLNSGEFWFSLEIYINYENRGFEIYGEDYIDILFLDSNRDYIVNR